LAEKLKKIFKQIDNFGLKNKGNLTKLYFYISYLWAENPCQIEFFIKSNKILKFFSFSKNETRVTKSWVFVKTERYFKFAREIKTLVVSSPYLFLLSTFFFSNPIPERQKELGLRRAKLGIRPRFARKNKNYIIKTLRQGFDAHAKRHVHCSQEFNVTLEIFCWYLSFKLTSFSFFLFTTCKGVCIAEYVPESM